MVSLAVGTLFFSRYPGEDIAIGKYSLCKIGIIIVDLRKAKIESEIGKSEKSFHNQCFELRDLSRSI